MALTMTSTIWWTRQKTDSGGDDAAPDGESVYAHYALHRLHILPSALMNLSIRERAFIYASIDEQIRAEKEANKRAERAAKKGGK